jgi:ribonuclease P protein component
VIGRLVRPADFERVLAAPATARTAHFAVHHLAARPGSGCPPGVHASSTELSTNSGDLVNDLVDDLGESLWLGTVVPRRHARRSVTRSLLKRQIRAAVGRQPGLPGGLWVVRLRAPFDRQQFVSAASEALQRATRTELDALLADAVLAPGRRGRRRG